MRNKVLTCAFYLTVETYNDMAFNDIFLHLLTGHLILLSDEFGSEDFCSAVFDGFLLTSFSRCVAFYPSFICPSKMIIFQTISVCFQGLTWSLFARGAFLFHFLLVSHRYTRFSCQNVFSFLMFCSKENVHRHTLRMLLHLHHKVLPSYMNTLMKTLEPPKQVGHIFFFFYWFFI